MAPIEPGKLLFAAYYHPENNTVELIITVKAYTNITITKLVIDNTTPDNPLYTYLVKTYSPPINVALGESWTTKTMFQPPAQQAQNWKIGTRHTAYLTITYGEANTARHRATVALTLLFNDFYQIQRFLFQEWLQTIYIILNQEICMLIFPHRYNVYYLV